LVLRQGVVILPATPVPPPIQLNGLLAGYASTDGRLWTILPTVPISYPVISIILALGYKRYTTRKGLEQPVTFELQTFGNDFFDAGVEAFVPRWDK
jgi:hypothetical protein